MKKRSEEVINRKKNRLISSLLDLKLSIID
jgi:hypothetical protein